MVYLDCEQSKLCAVPFYVPSPGFGTLLLDEGDHLLPLDLILEREVASEHLDFLFVFDIVQPNCESVTVFNNNNNNNNNNNTKLYS